MTAAATALHRSQPALSRQITELEKEMGVRIFSRTRNKVVGLTPAGLDVLAAGQRVTRELDALRQIGARGDDGGAELRIATTHIHARYSLPRVIKAFSERFPDVLLNLQQGHPLGCCQLVAEGEADFGISIEPERMPRELITIPVYKMSRCVLVPKRHPLTRGKLTLARIAEYPIIAYTRPPHGRWMFGSAFADAGLKPHIIMSAIDADVSKTYIAMGMGIAVMASMSYDPAEDRHLTAVGADHLFRHGMLTLVFRRGAYVSRHVLALLADFAPHIDSETLRRCVDEGVLDRSRLARNAPYLATA
jgi:LysR family cys regulon transcriptional activator